MGVKVTVANRKEIDEETARRREKDPMFNASDLVREFVAEGLARLAASRKRPAKTGT
jgi:hypothetical protein